MGEWVDPGLGDYQDMKPDRVRSILIEATRMAHTRMNHYPAWLFTSEVFRVGPKQGLNLCLHAGFDPNRSVRAQGSDAAASAPPPVRTED